MDQACLLLTSWRITFVTYTKYKMKDYQYQLCCETLRVHEVQCNNSNSRLGFYKDGRRKSKECVRLANSKRSQRYTEVFRTSQQLQMVH